MPPLLFQMVVMMSSTSSHRARLLVGDAEAAQLNLRGRAPGADFDPAIAQDIQRRDALGDSNGVVVGEGQEHHRVTDADRAGALRDRAVQHFRRGRMGKADLEVMLDGPKVGDPPPPPPGPPASSRRGTPDTRARDA